MQATTGTPKYHRESPEVPLIAGGTYSDPPSYVSAKSAQYALEVNQGFFEERGVEVGDRAELPR